ncbi:MAG: peptide deformylase, partial [Candidatus Shikimatogenerans sp. JK-2022]|nr:peptide deformylase [Candidatus Shikimatogenerans bostrichidophilus]
KKIKLNIKKLKNNKLILNYEYSKKNIINKEGCLSIPNIYVNIIRKKVIHVEYYDSLWKKRRKKLKNLLSIIFQHEYDHLKGKLILDYIK